MASNVFKVPEQVRLERLSSEEGLCEFCCGVEEYTEFLQKQAMPYQDRCISKVYLLKESKSNNILAYMALIADAINLCPTDKKDSGLSDIPFNSLPAVKLAKLVVDSTAKKTFNHLGIYMIALAKAIALTSIFCLAKASSFSRSIGLSLLKDSNVERRA